MGVRKDFLRQEAERASRAGSSHRIAGWLNAATAGFAAPVQRECRTGPTCPTCRTSWALPRRARRLSTAGIAARFSRPSSSGQVPGEVLGGRGFRYAAHLDIVRALYRALRRSEVPVAYSQGFAPRPVVAFGPPLPVGLTSAEEYLDLTMAGHYPGNLIRDLGPAMPRDMRVLDARPVFTRVASLGAGLTVARYAVQARDLGETDATSAKTRVGAIPGVRQLDFLEQAGPGRNFDLVLAMTRGVKLFPALQQLFERDEATVRCWRIQRRACFMERDGKLVSPMEEL